LATVFVGNLAPGVTDTELREVFAKYGKILSLRLISRRGLAFVELETPAAEAAIEGLRGVQLRERTMDVALEQSSQGKRKGFRRR